MPGSHFRRREVDGAEEIVIDIEWSATEAVSKGMTKNRNVVVVDDGTFVVTETHKGFTAEAIARGSVVAEGFEFIIDITSPGPPFAAAIFQGTNTSSTNIQHVAK